MKKSPGKAVIKLVEGQQMIAGAKYREGMDAYEKEVFGNAKIAGAIEELEPQGAIERVAGGEVLTKEDNEDFLIDVTKHPDLVTLQACRERLTLADDAQSLHLAIDAVESVDRPTSIEKMLLHQMATAHRSYMILMAKADQVYREYKPKYSSDWGGKIIAQATKLMNAYQTGANTLVKLKTAGKQQIVIQHVNVSGDAQAVVAGKMDYPKKPDTGGPGGG